jgi:hypothetical protein
MTELGSRHRATAGHPVKVFIASPGDIKCEREICRKVINEWKDAKFFSFEIKSFFWEYDALPGVGSYTQDVISKQSLKADQNGGEFDIVIVILWSRIGTETKYFLSGTAEELITALLTSYRNPKRVMLYSSDTPIKPSQIDPQQLAGVKRLRKCFQDAGGLHFSYDSIGQFEELIRRHLAQAIRELSERKPADLTARVSSHGSGGFNRNPTDEFADLLNGIVKRLAACESRMNNNSKSCIALIRRVAEFFVSFEARRITRSQAELQADLATFGQAIDREFNFSINKDDIELFFQSKIVLAFTPVQSTTIAALRDEFIQILKSAISKAQDYKTVIIETTKLIDNSWPRKVYMIPKNSILSRIQEENGICNEMEKIAMTISGLLGLNMNSDNKALPPNPRGLS